MRQKPWEEIQVDTYARADELQGRLDRGEDVKYASRMAPFLRQLARTAAKDRANA